jgi:hypothetical protein
VERCATPEDRDLHLTQLQTKLEERGYPSEKVKAQFDRAKKKDRKEGIEKTKRRKRKFRRNYLQPQPKKARRRRRKEHPENSLDEEISSVWNGIVKNISDEPVEVTEEMLFAKGQKFCPVEPDPPIVRMQSELNRFFRILRIKWIFYDKPDKRTS